MCNDGTLYVCSWNVENYEPETMKNVIERNVANGRERWNNNNENHDYLGNE